MVRQWKRRFEAAATAAVATNEDVVPVSAPREAHQRIRELERLLGKKQMKIEILQAGSGCGNIRAMPVTDSVLLVFLAVAAVIHMAGIMILGFLLRNRFASRALSVRS